MAAAAQEEARRLHLAKEAFERASSMAEGITYKAWKEETKRRNAAAIAAAKASAAQLKAEAEALAAERASPCYELSFFLPFRRHDVWKELSLYEDPLDYPSESWHSQQRAGAIGALSTGSLLSVAPGLVRSLERRFTLSSDTITLELMEISPPSLLRWKVLRQTGSGGLAPMMPDMEGEDYDGNRATPGLDVVLENAPYGTSVTLRVGTHAYFATPPLLHCFRPLLAATIGCMESYALRASWSQRMQSRGHKPLEAKSSHRGAGSGLAALVSSPGKVRSPLLEPMAHGGSLGP